MEEGAAKSHFGHRIGAVVGGWPRLFLSLAIAIAIFAVSVMLGLAPPVAALVAWDGGVIFYLAAATEMMATATVADIRQRAERQDVGQFVVLGLTALAAIASIGAIYAELSIAAGTSEGWWRFGLAILTFILSWLFVHTFFALHYAREYYAPGKEPPGGLDFPGKDDLPDYWDFVYFSLSVGMTSQTSDVTITDRRIRRTVLAHAVIAFFFNVTLLALVVNIAASAIQVR
jgi:uncharacterized membrane protein